MKNNSVPFASCNIFAYIGRPSPRLSYSRMVGDWLLSVIEIIFLLFCATPCKNTKIMAMREPYYPAAPRYCEFNLSKAINLPRCLSSIEGDGQKRRERERDRKRDRREMDKTERAYIRGGKERRAACCQQFSRNFRPPNLNEAGFAVVSCAEESWRFFTTGE